MGIIYSPKSRRQFLIGAGKTMLALPVLPSLLPSWAQAQTAPPRRMMGFIINHHNEWDYWPSRSVATVRSPVPSGRTSINIMERVLRELGTTTNAVGCKLLSDPFYNSLLMRDQITIARSFNTYISDGNGHVTRALGGHSVDEFGTSSTNNNHRSTIDFVVENSRTFYPSTPTGFTKSIRVDLHGAWTYVHRVGNTSTNPGAYGYGDIGEMYNAVFGSLTGGTTAPVDLTNTRKTNILNRVFPAFQSYRNNRKISSDDRVRLDQHLGFLSDLQRSFASVMPPVTSNCQRPSAPGSGLNNRQITELYAFLLAAAFKCGVTRFGTMQFEFHDPRWLPNMPDRGVHGMIHGDNGLVDQHLAFEIYNKFCYDTIANHFMRHLDVEEGSSGRTYLDNMVTVALTHAGMQGPNETGNHYDWDLQHMIFGSMGGRLRSGRYYAFPHTNDHYLPANTFHMTLLNLLGIPSSEYSLNSSITGQGFGYYRTTNTPFGNRIYEPIHELLA